MVLRGQPGLRDQEGCVDVVAVPPDGSRLRPDTVEKVPIVFRVESPIDTVTVELVLRSLPP